jgi:heat shock protein HtpX
MASFYDAMGENKRNSIVLIAVVFALVLLVAYFFAYLTDLGPIGPVIAIFIAVAYSIGGYYYSDKIVLSISGAKPAEKKDYPYLYNTTEGLAIAAGIPMPRLYVIEDAAPNAFATGRDPAHSAIAVTTGLLQIMNRQELEGVIAHEMSHIKNFDIRFATLTIVMVGMISIMGDFAMRYLFWGGGRNREGRGGHPALMLIGLALIILSPIIAQLVRLALSRQREFLADATGAQLTRYPPGLASALEKIGKSGSKVARATDTTASLYIANPLPGKLMSFFSTHPPIEERVKRLRAM